MYKATSIHTQTTARDKIIEILSVIQHSDVSNSLTNRKHTVASLATPLVRPSEIIEAV